MLNTYIFKKKLPAWKCRKTVKEILEKMHFSKHSKLTFHSTIFDVILPKKWRHLMQFFVQKNKPSNDHTKYITVKWYCLVNVVRNYLTYFKDVYQTSSQRLTFLRFLPYNFVTKLEISNYDNASTIKYQCTFNFIMWFGSKNQTHVLNCYMW